ncbi:MAG: histidinol-phosphatase [Litoreibacter sp.]|nr:histidinol-phosphatase [Litoreibacter sp.]
MDDATRLTCLSLADQLAEAARAETLTYFRRPDIATDNKLESGFDPVTEGDRAAEAAMRKLIEAQRPDDGILGEEFGSKESKSGLTWVLDPIDGTRGYISGTPTWGTLIALHDGAKPVLGVIDQPYIGERFVGGLGQSHLDGPRGRDALQVSKVTKLSEATILTTFPEVGTSEEGAKFHAVAERCKLTRYGMDCYGYALLALGQVELVVEAGLQPYDIQAPIAVVEAAGGIVTDWSGGSADGGGRALAAATPELHAAALEILGQV